MTDREDELKHIRELETVIISNIAEVNALTDIVDFMKRDENEDEVVLAALHALRRLFMTFIGKGELFPPTTRTKKSKGSDEVDPEVEVAMAAYRRFLEEQYTTFLNHTMALLQCEEAKVQCPALRTLMAFVGREGDARGGGQGATGASAFPNELYFRVVRHLLCNDHLEGSLVGTLLEEYVGLYDDVRYFTLHGIWKVIQSKRADAVTRTAAAGGANQGEGAVPRANKNAGGEVDSRTVRGCSEMTLARNVWMLLQHIRMPSSSGQLGTFLVEACGAEGGADDGAAQVGEKRKSRQDATKAGDAPCNLRAHRKVFSESVLGMLKLSLPADVYRGVLLALPQRMLPHMLNPLLLADFLTDAYDLGGVSALLSLNALFILMHKHNLDYPDFYPRLYRLLSPQMFHVRYRARFLRLLALFLTSTALPAYLVAAFCKRLSRLSLTAPPSASLFSIALIHSLLTRHVACRVLIHRVAKVKPGSGAGAGGRTAPASTIAVTALQNVTGSGTAVATTKPSRGPNAAVVAAAASVDPYVDSEQDPSRCGALDSSLWELFSLQRHYVAAVSTFAAVMEEPFGKTTKYDIEDFSSFTYRSLIQGELKRRNKANEVPFEFAAPEGLFQASDAFVGVFDV